MSDEIIKRPEVQAETLEKVLLGGNLSVLTPQERMTYYKAVCDSVGLNPLTRPFEYLNLNGKLVLYARREATEQLRKIHGVSIGKLEKTFHGDDLYIVEAPASDKTGRTDSSTGAVNIKGLSGEAKANALMKCETKAKRRVTLSICGLGMLDETEVETIPGAVRVDLPNAPALPVPEGEPVIDLRGDLLEEGEQAMDLMELAQERPQKPPPPAQMEIGLPRASQTPKTAIQTAAEEKRAKFLAEMKKLEAALPSEIYHAALGLAGYTRPEEITDSKTMTDVYRSLKKQILAPGPEKGR